MLFAAVELIQEYEKKEWLGRHSLIYEACLVMVEHPEIFSERADPCGSPLSKSEPLTG
jgi:hypothetical protein